MGGFLAFVGFVVTGVALFALARGRLAWARITTRKQGGGVAAGGLLVMTIGGLLSPSSDKVASENAQRETPPPSAAPPSWMSSRRPLDRLGDLHRLRQPVHGERRRLVPQQAVAELPVVVSPPRERRNPRRSGGTRSGGEQRPSRQHRGKHRGNPPARATARRSHDGVVPIAGAAGATVYGSWPHRDAPTPTVPAFASGRVANPPACRETQRSAAGAALPSTSVSTAQSLSAAERSHTAKPPGISARLAARR